MKRSPVALVALLLAVPASAKNAELGVRGAKGQALVAGEPGVSFNLVDKGRKLSATVVGPGLLTVRLHGLAKGPSSFSAASIFLDRKKVHFIDLRGAAKTLVSAGGYTAGPVKVETVSIPDGSHEVDVEAFVGPAAVSFRMAGSGNAAAGGIEKARTKRTRKPREKKKAVAAAVVAVSRPPASRLAKPVVPAHPRVAAPRAQAAQTPAPPPPPRSDTLGGDDMLMMGEPPPAAAPVPPAKAAAAMPAPAKPAPQPAPGSGGKSPGARQSPSKVRERPADQGSATAAAAAAPAPAPAAATSAASPAPAHSSAPYWLAGGAVVLGASAGVLGYLSSGQNKTYLDTPETNSGRNGMRSTANTELVIAESLAAAAVVALAVGLWTSL